MDVVKPQLDPQVAEAFEITTEFTLLPGGTEFTTFRAGDLVLRYHGADRRKHSGTPRCFTGCRKMGFASPGRSRPRTALIVNGWTAEQFLAGRNATKDDLPQVIVAATRFHQALRDIPTRPTAIVNSACTTGPNGGLGDIPPNINPKLLDIVSGLASLRRPVALPFQLIHGDLNLDNVLIADGAPPAIIDMTPCFQPAEFALAVDAYWVGPYEGDLEILQCFEHVPELTRCCSRAGLRMILTQPDPHRARYLDEYRRSAEVIERFVLNART